MKPLKENKLTELEKTFVKIGIYRIEELNTQKEFDVAKFETPCNELLWNSKVVYRQDLSHFVLHRPFSKKKKKYLGTDIFARILVYSNIKALSYEGHYLKFQNSKSIKIPKIIAAPIWHGLNCSSGKIEFEYVEFDTSLANRGYKILLDEELVASHGPHKAIGLNLEQTIWESKKDLEQASSDAYERIKVK